MNYLEMLSKIENEQANNVATSIIKTNNIINRPEYKNIICSISGGADSDIMLDLCYNLDVKNKIKYIWFDTGLEYQATKDHLEYLENKYKIEIIRKRAIKPIPLAVKEYGQPFLSKFVSAYIEGLQKHNFNWEDEPYDVLIKKYPKAKTYISWWCNTRIPRSGFKSTQFNINRNKGLKEFLIANPPRFKISSKCCYYAKKKVAEKVRKEYDCDLEMLGIRKSEGGIRATSYKNCFTVNEDKEDKYRPLFYYTNADKKLYEIMFNIKHSNCYTLYGMKRTGCVGCPFNKDIEKDLQIIKQYEPKLYNACVNIFKDSYEYTKEYIKFKESLK